MKKKKGIWDEVVQEANVGLEGSAKQMWQGISGMVKENENREDTGIATLRSGDGKLGSSGKGKMKILVDHFLGNWGCHQKTKPSAKCSRRRWTHERRTKRLHRKAAVDYAELQKEFNEDEVASCVGKLQCHKAGGVDGIVHEFIKFGGEGMVQMMVLLYKCL